VPAAVGGLLVVPAAAGPAMGTASPAASAATARGMTRARRERIRVLLGLMLEIWNVMADTR
jgi:hypothetical protein